MLSYGGGADIWGKRSSDLPKATESTRLARMVDSNDERCTGTWAVPSIDDGVLEVVGVTGSFHLARLQVGLAESAIRLAQCRTLTLHIHDSLPMQIDGEPWIQQPCEITVSHRNRSMMLSKNSQFLGQVAAKCADILEWGRTHNVITTEQRDILLREVARRGSLVSV